MRAGDIAAILIRPTLSGTMRARQTKKEYNTVTKIQWLGYVTVAAATTWLTKALNDFIETHLSAPPDARDGETGSHTAHAR